MKTLIAAYTDEGRVKITFNGLWTRRDIDGVNAAILRELPAHIAEHKKNLLKEKEDEPRRAESESTASE